MKKILLITAIVAAIYVGYGKTNGFSQPSTSPAIQTNAEHASAFNTVQAAIKEQKRGAYVLGEGVVSKLLADDNDGSHHQRFILALPSGQTILVAHNIDLAHRIATLKAGDAVAFKGVYEWNAKGGVVHWTHRDPGGRHQAGWLKHAGQTYQ